MFPAGGKNMHTQHIHTAYIRMYIIKFLGKNTNRSVCKHFYLALFNLSEMGTDLDVRVFDPPGYSKGRRRRVGRGWVCAYVYVHALCEFNPSEINEEKCHYCVYMSLCETSTFLHNWSLHRLYCNTFESPLKHQNWFFPYKTFHDLTSLTSEWMFPLSFPEEGTEYGLESNLFHDDQ